ncbi:hypothetical protein ABZ951_10960 [Streptomyces sp. NPDC046215]|uniref:Secreted protein n=1 Tax=Streptomyces stramineus TaxID=173861 RepID=A0ABP3K176_9ACTN
MPRPTPAQIILGSATVIFSTLAMLLLAQPRSGIGTAVIALAALALGLLVAVTVPAPRASRHGIGLAGGAGKADRGGKARRVRVRRTSFRVPGQRAPLPAESRMGESLHG